MHFSFFLLYTFNSIIRQYHTLYLYPVLFMMLLLTNLLTKLMNQKLTVMHWASNSNLLLIYV